MTISHLLLSCYLNTLNGEQWYSLCNFGDICVFEIPFRGRKTKQNKTLFRDSIHICGIMQLYKISTFFWYMFSNSYWMTHSGNFESPMCLFIILLRPRTVTTLLFHQTSHFILQHLPWKMAPTSIQLPSCVDRGAILHNWTSDQPSMTLSLSDHRSNLPLSHVDSP